MSWQRGDERHAKKKSGEFDQNKYINQFQKENHKRITVLVPKINTELIKHIESQPNKSGYILNLIYKDMYKNIEKDWFIHWYSYNYAYNKIT